MNFSKYQSEPNDKDFGIEVDNLIKEKINAEITIIRAQISLLDAGVKIIANGKLEHLPNLDIDAFRKCKLQEFYWKAEYNNGKEIKQFDTGKENSYQDIDQSMLRSISWVSNFEDNTDNFDRHIIFKLNWDTGIFEMLNGGALQETRTIFIKGYPVGVNPKLILKMIRRQSATVGIQSQNKWEKFIYNRYLLGWEDTNLAAKTLLCLEPNGYVHPFHS